MDACLADANCLACLQGDDEKCTGPVLDKLNACADTKCKNECTGSCNDGGTNYSGANACDTCQNTEFGANGCCGSEAAACSNNADCVAINECLTPCQGDQSCIDACAAKHAKGVDAFNALITCTFGDGTTTDGACGIVCGSNSASCNDGGTNYGAANNNNCSTCQDSETTAGGCCESEANGCGNNNACISLVNCVNGCSDNACVQKCGDANPGGIDDFNAFVGCLFGAQNGQVGSCGTVCNF
jgi:hypothetical protein